MRLVRMSYMVKRNHFRVPLSLSFKATDFHNEDFARRRLEMKAEVNS